MRTLYRNGGPDSPYLWRMLRALNYLWRHLDGPVPLEGWRRRLACRPFTFTRVSRPDGRNGGRDPAAAVAASRGRAVERLAAFVEWRRAPAGGGTAAFVRAFARAYGESPGRYRQRRAFISKQDWGDRYA